VSEAVDLIGQYENAGVQLLINSDYRNDMETHELMAAERWFAGKVVEIGRRHGISTPVNGFIYAALKPYVNGAPNEP
jgi:ketopantoate reductase